MCEEFESLHDGSGQPDVLMGQLIVLSAIKTEVPLESDDPANQNFYYNNMKNELTSYHNQTNWVNFVWMQDFWVLWRVDSISWRKTLEIWHNFMHYPVVNTLCQEKTVHHNQEDGSRETQKLGPYWKLQPVTCTVNMELRSENYVFEQRQYSLLGQNFSWIKFVMDLNNNDTEIPEDQPEEQALQLDVKDFACWSKAKAKPQRREPAGSSSRIIPMERRNWIDIEPVKYSLWVRGFEESDSSSSSFTESTSRRRWSGSFLDHKGKSSESIPTVNSLVWYSMETMFDSRRSKQDIPVL